MLAKNQKEFIELFNTIEDPREDGKILYSIAEILFLVIAGVLSCAESWREIVRYGNMNIEFLRNYLPTFIARNAAQNMGIVRKLIINMIRCYKKITGDEIAIKTVRKASSWSINETAKVLNFMVAN